MDKNTLIGLGLIGAILATFTFMYKPDAPAKKDAKAKTEIQQTNQADAKTTDDKNKTVDKIATPETTDSTSKVVAVSVEKGELVRLETDKLILDFSTKGGVLAAVYLKEFTTYSQYAKKYEGEKITLKPLKLFGEDDAVNALVFPLDGKSFSTADKLFEVKNQSKNGITLALSPAEGQTIEYIYALKPKSYEVDFEVKMTGFEGKVAATNVMLEWNADLKKTERLLSEQRRVSTVCYQYKDGELDYLSEMADDEETEIDQNINWVAFKQSYFTTIMKPVSGFSKTGTTFKVTNFEEGAAKYHSHIKRYESKMNLGFTNTGAASAKVNWYFGPNDYETLKSFDSGYEDIINFGWGLFRWINIYAIQPIFNVLSSTGLGFGMVILLLTFILKLALTPIQWKMYVSSAKMRILKPEVDALNEKYPKKEDAMKKQMDMMALYRESGASPLAGCVPMLIQMPILLAVFRFFPASFELRQQSFLWAEDLSSYDSVYDLGFYIPLYGDHISLFTILMAVTTLVYTHLNSGNMQQPQQPGMPNMKVLMYIFPFMMIFFFNNYSSGLSYYYFISTLMSILIMVAIKQFFVDEEKLKAKMAARKVSASSNGGTKKKSKFQERLEQMQKAQQEKLKAKK
jgi:YidC/Oxa1 family membrane protein insertase